MENPEIARQARSRAPSVVAALAGIITLAASGCAAGRSYRPSVPHAHRGAVSELEAELVQVETTSGFRVILKLRGGKGARLTRALLAPSAATPCREGVRDQGLILDGKLEWLRPVPMSGEHDVELMFPAAAAGDLLAQTPVIDLVIPTDNPEAEQCLRLALSGKSPELAFERRVDWSIDLALRAVYPSRPVGSVDNGWSLDVGAARWIGPLRVRAEAGIGIADCSGHCPPEPDGEEGFTWFPLRLALDGYVLETRGFGIAAELGYQQFSAYRTNPDESTRWETNRGPRGAIRFDFTPAPPAGWPWGGRQSSFGLELSLGRWGSAQHSDAALVWGIGVVNYVGF